MGNFTVNPVERIMQIPPGYDKGDGFVWQRCPKCGKKLFQCNMNTSKGATIRIKCSGIMKDGTKCRDLVDIKV